MPNKIDRKQVEKNILNSVDPTGEMLNSITNNVFSVDHSIASDLQGNMDTFKNSLAQALKNVDNGFSGDISGALFKYYSSQGNPEELQKLKSLMGGLNATGMEENDLMNNSFLSLGYLSYNSNIQKVRDLDLLVSMIPQLQEVLDTMTDAVIASDSFNNLVSFQCDDDTMDNLKTLDNKYDFNEKLRYSIYDGLQYGYSHTAVIPFKKAFEQFKMMNKDYRAAVMAKEAGKVQNFNVSKFSEKMTSISESYSSTLKEKMKVLDVPESELSISEVSTLAENTKLFLENVRIYDDSMALLESSDIHQLSEVMKEKATVNKRKEKFRKAMEKQKMKEKEKEENKSNTPNDNSGDNTNAFKNTKNVSSDIANNITDGLLNSKNRIQMSDIDTSGCIIKNLCLKKLLPIEIDETVLGYYYIEDNGVIENMSMNTMDPMMALSTMGSVAMQDRSSEIERANGEYFKELSDILVASLVKDKDFLKKNNRFKEQVYSIVRYGNLVNKSLKITYLTPDQVIRFGNGKSMIERSLFYGKLYLALLITNIMLRISRGYDKRIYLTKSAVAPEAAKSTLQAIKEIKKDQRSVTMLTNVNSILNMAGTTNDLFIPMDAQGNKTIDYDVMSGQDITIKDELLEFLEDRMLSGTGVPTPLLQATTDTDFSRTLVMLNSKFLRRSLTYQRIYNNPACEMYNRVNAADMGLDIDDEEYDIVIISFLPPSALGINAMNEQVGNAKDLVDTINRAYTDSGLYGDAIPGEFSKALLKDICPVLPWNRIDKIFEQVKQQTPLIKKSIPQDDGGANM